MFKKRKCLFIYLILVLSLAITSCAYPERASEVFSNYCNAYFVEEISSSTINLHYTLSDPQKYGIYNCPITYGSLDLAELDNYSEQLLSNIEALKAITYSELSLKDQLTYDILFENLTFEYDNAHLIYYSEILSPVCGTQAQLPILLAEYSLNSEQDVIDYISLLSVTDKYFEKILNFEKRKAELGLFMADFAVDDIISQCNDFINSNGDYLIATFNDRIENIDELSDSSKQNYILQNKSQVQNHVIDAYKLLVNGLSSLKGSGINQGGLSGLPEGKAYYEYLVKSSTGSSRTVEELIELALTQMQSDLSDMSSIASSNPAVLTMTDSYNFTLSEPDTILDDLAQKITNDFPEFPESSTTVKYVHESLAEHISPAFYLTPTIDYYYDNTIYINPSSDYGKLDLYTTLAHEGYPGHLYQNVYFNSTSPDPIRHVLNYGGYTEGWATYVEMYSYQLSGIDQDLAKLLQLNNSVTLGIYACLDMLIHYRGWDVDRTYDFISNFGFDNKETAEQIYNIIVEEPANYLKYYIGYLELLELKKSAQNMLNEDYTDKVFHKAVLTIGPADFSIIEKYLPLYLDY